MVIFVYVRYLFIMQVSSYYKHQQTQFTVGQNLSEHTIFLKYTYKELCSHRAQYTKRLLILSITSTWSYFSFKPWRYWVNKWVYVITVHTIKFFSYNSSQFFEVFRFLLPNYSFSLLRKFSIGFKSGLCEGKFILLIELARIKFLTTHWSSWPPCFGSLSFRN